MYSSFFFLLFLFLCLSVSRSVLFLLLLQALFPNVRFTRDLETWKNGREVGGDSGGLLVWICGWPCISLSILSCSLRHVIAHEIGICSWLNTLAEYRWAYEHICLSALYE